MSRFVPVFGTDRLSDMFLPYPSSLPSFTFPYEFELVSLCLLTPLLTKPNRFCAREFFTERDFKAVFVRQEKSVSLDQALERFFKVADAKKLNRYNLSDFHPNPMAELMSDDALLKAVFKIPYENQVITIESLDEAIVHVVENSLNPDRLTFILKEPVDDTLPVVIYQRHLAHQYPEVWEAFKRGERSLNDFEPQDERVCPLMQRVWSLYEDGWRYELELVTWSGRTVVSNGQNYSSGGPSRKLVAFAYEQIHLAGQKFFKSNFDQKPTLIKPPRLSMDYLVQFARLSKNACSCSVLDACAMNCFEFGRHFGVPQETLDSLSIGMALLSRFPSMTLQRLYSVVERKDRSSLEVMRDDFFGFQAFMALFTDSVRVANDGDAAGAARLLLSGCARLTHQNQEILELIARVFLKLVDMAEEGEPRHNVITQLLRVYDDAAGLLKLIGVKISPKTIRSRYALSAGVHKYANMRDLLRILRSALAELGPSRYSFDGINISIREELIRYGKDAVREPLCA